MTYYRTATGGSFMGCVYRAYDKAGTLLYIGTTRNFEARLLDHSRNSVWRGQVARWHVRWHMDWMDAWAAEKAAIHSEHPRWNIRDRSPLHPDGQLKSRTEVAALYPHDLLSPTSLHLRDSGWLRDVEFTDEQVAA